MNCRLEIVIMCSNLIVLCLMKIVVLTTMAMTDISQRLANGLDTMDITDEDYVDSREYLDPSSSGILRRSFMLKPTSKFPLRYSLTKRLIVSTFLFW